MKNLLIVLFALIWAPNLIAGSCKAVNYTGEITSKNADYETCRKSSKRHNSYTCSDGWDNGQAQSVYENSYGVCTTYYIARDADMVITTVFRAAEVQSTDVSVRP